MKHGFRPRRTVSPAVRAECYRRYYASLREPIHMIQGPTGLVVSQELWDQMRTAAAPAVATIEAFRAIGTPVHVSPLLPVYRSKDRQTRRYAHWRRVRDRKAGVSW